MVELSAPFELQSSEPADASEELLSREAQHDRLTLGVNHQTKIGNMCFYKIYTIKKWSYHQFHEKPLLFSAGLVLLFSTSSTFSLIPILPRRVLIK
jgi:hypothetical protein